MKKRSRKLYRKKRHTRKRKMIGGSSNINTKELEIFIARTNPAGPKEIHGIPLVIYRTWNDKNVPIGMWKSLQSSKEKTPEFDNYFYDDAARLKSIEDNFEPNVVKAYKCLKPGSFKSDLWRYCILYLKGGIYIDMDLEIVVPLLPILQENPKLYIQQVIPERKHCVTEYPGVMTGFMVFPPKSPVLRACIDEVILNCKNRDYKVDFLDITGPCLLARMIAKVEGSEVILSSSFQHKVLKQFHYKDILFLQEYKDKNNEPATAGDKHYSQYVAERDVFDTSIVFDT